MFHRKLTAKLSIFGDCPFKCTVFLQWKGECGLLWFYFSFDFYSLLPHERFLQRCSVKRGWKCTGLYNRVVSSWYVSLGPLCLRCVVATAYQRQCTSLTPSGWNWATRQLRWETRCTDGLGLVQLKWSYIFGVRFAYLRWEYGAFTLVCRVCFAGP